MENAPVAAQVFAVVLGLIALGVLVWSISNRE